VAAELGAERVRVIAGQSKPSQAAFERSAAALGRLAEAATAYGMRLTTENWYGLLARPEHVWSLLHGLEGRVGLNLDFGNWEGPTKYADLAEIAPLAESCHAKGDVAAGQLDRADFAACLRLLQEVNFGGPYTLIYGEDSRSHGEYEMVQEALAKQEPRQPITL
jgi:sugar phosphate isomerase/epimerase